MGWVSVNKYSLLGSFRGVSQMVSYEIIFFLLGLRFILIMESYNFNYILIIQNLRIPAVFLIFPYFIILYFSLLAEINRTPCDLVEGESELVSGFNVEYISIGLRFIFIAEFIGIMVRILILRLMIYGAYYLIIGLLISVSVLWIRARLPRLRYDILIIII